MNSSLGWIIACTVIVGCLGATVITFTILHFAGVISLDTLLNLERCPFSCGNASNARILTEDVIHTVGTTEYGNKWDLATCPAGSLYLRKGNAEYCTSPTICSSKDADTCMSGTTGRAVCQLV